MDNFKPMRGRYASAERNSISENAVTISVQREIAQSCTTIRAAHLFREMFHRLTPLVLVDEVVLGHFKGMIQCGDAVYALSVTRASALDEAVNEDWKQLERMAQFTVTINLLSIVPCKLCAYDLEAAIDQLEHLCMQ